MCVLGDTFKELGVHWRWMDDMIVRFPVILVAISGNFGVERDVVVVGGRNFHRLQRARNKWNFFNLANNNNNGCKYIETGWYIAIHRRVMDVFKQRGETAGEKKLNKEETVGKETILSLFVLNGGGGWNFPRDQLTGSFMHGKCGEFHSVE